MAVNNLGAATVLVAVKEFENIYHSALTLIYVTCLLLCIEAIDSTRDDMLNVKQMPTTLTACKKQEKDTKEIIYAKEKEV